VFVGARWGGSRLFCWVALVARLDRQRLQGLSSCWQLSGAVSPEGFKFGCCSPGSHPRFPSGCSNLVYGLSEVRPAAYVDALIAILAGTVSCSAPSAKLAR